MSIPTCTRRIQFCAGHRVLGHESKCANPHGHNYVALITAQAYSLDDIGRVVDFSVLKTRIGGWIDEHWDHGFLVYREDKELFELLNRMETKKLFVCSFNPTAENMAEHLHLVANRLCAQDRITISQVQLWETENCYATFSG